ncbi:MAG: hypothetical protein NTW50_01895 [Candidatus Berkelbacteria bacterium]|nr:hypothetical protein [Candidatus Berkelbacteria bacterium]
MPLNKKDLSEIKNLLTTELQVQHEKTIEEVKDIVDFAISNSELRSENRFNKIDERFDKIDQKFDDIDVRFNSIDREINDLIETNQAFLGKFDNHEKRISRLETKASMTK